MLQRVTLVCLALLLGRGALAATDIACVPAEEGAVTLDGLLPDWRDVAGLTLDDADHVVMGRAAWRGASDLSVTVKCLRSDTALYLAFDVKDDYLVRMREAKPGEDHLLIHFADDDQLHTIAIYPGDLKGVPRKVVAPGKLARAMEVAEARQPRGWSVEVRLPIAAIPGFSARAMAIRGGIAVADCDSKVHAKTEKIMSTSDGHQRASQLGRFTFGETQDVLAHFLKQQGLTARDVVFDRSIEMGGDPGLERVVVAGQFLAVFGEEYYFVKLNVKSVKDVSDFRLVDLTGDGKHAMVVKTIERAGNGARQILHVFKLIGAGIQRPFAAEVAKESGGRKLVSRVSFVRHKKKTDIVIEAGKPAGWNDRNYQEQAADDVIPILLPWSDKTKARYRFKGDEFEEVK
ncbi:MAG TPA: sugar-binding protein [Polyangia bacterium]|jgi:hypothetical protein